MSHYINGFIAKLRPLEAAAASLPSAVVCALASGFGFLPLRDVSDTDAPSGLPSCERLSAAMEAWAVVRSHSFPLAYVQTEYFGGLGFQSAVVWDGGKVVFGPVPTGNEEGKVVAPLLDGAINRALRILGVSRGRSIDEFDALGLGRHRLNEDWRNAADASDV